MKWEREKKKWIEMNLVVGSSFIMFLDRLIIWNETEAGRTRVAKSFVCQLEV